jgi:DNA-binding SARP family transcriptional activator
MRAEDVAFRLRNALWNRSDKSSGRFSLHDVIAGIDACRAAYAFHLQSILDIDAGKFLHTAAAVHAVARVWIRFLPRGSPRAES